MPENSQFGWTMKEIADELGVNKMRVYRTITRNAISETGKKGQTLYYNDAAKEKIVSIIQSDEPDQEEPKAKKASRPKATAPSTQTANINSSIFSSLNEQISSQQEQIETLTRLLDQSQKLQMIAEKQSHASERKVAELESKIKMIEVAKPIEIAHESESASKPETKKQSTQQVSDSQSSPTAVALKSNNDGTNEEKSESEVEPTLTSHYAIKQLPNVVTVVANSVANFDQSATTIYLPNPNFRVEQSLNSKSKSKDKDGFFKHFWQKPLM
ncbi:helix-turn-helix domain-containing protein [Lentilactobacillus sp. Marseille-Q4993]|uniref:helix-turn-helix domain-containing protein n=1 Tax=Lentilactobacillus sp. Marseille-Q4993 TaxID=3039492 RepID=UPI0024BD172B|nr:helix-turn-helix domain-containing protein [Lentilactobacillus sp. Marseille-Q4993]